jgi:DNA-binding MarR family transcriptional regulator
VTPADTGAARALANVLGALALVVTDELTRTIIASADQRSATDAAALAALAQFLDGATLDRVHHVLGVTPSGAVRLVDRLAGAGLVTREAGPDGRSRAVRLTEAGRIRARTVHAARAAYLSGLTAGLSPEEVATLRDLLGRVMGNVVAAKAGGAWTCRLCDMTACRRAEGECPALNAALGSVSESGTPGRRTADRTNHPM